MNDRKHRSGQIAVEGKTPKEARVDALFAVARDTPAPPLSDDLFARIMADAADTQPRRTRCAIEQGAGRRAWLDLLGGWPTLAGLTTATLAGVWIGVAQPASIVELRGDLGLIREVSQNGETAYGIEDLMPGFDSLAQEG